MVRLLRILFPAGDAIPSASQRRLDLENAHPAQGHREYMSIGSGFLPHDNQLSPAWG